MVRLVVTANAETDIDCILLYLEREAGKQTAAGYGDRFLRSLDRFVEMPESGHLRPVLGPHARIEIVTPYILIYDYSEHDKTVTLLRVLHGKQNITERLLGRVD